MNRMPLLVPLMIAAAAAWSGCVSRPSLPPAELAADSLDLKKAQAEVRDRYAAAHPEIQEYVLWTAVTFGPSGLWLNEDAFSNLSASKRDAKIAYLASLLEGGEYGRHLCRGLAEAGSLRDNRLLPGLLKVAGYQKANADYDCRPKWMAVAALARQESPSAVPLLVSLVDHGNENTRKWARAALARLTKQDFGADKKAWADWWREQGHAPLDESYLKPWTPPPSLNNK